MNTMTTDISIGELMTTTAWVMLFSWAGPIVLTSLFTPRWSALRRISRAGAWIVGPAFGTYLGYRLATLLPDAITRPQRNVDIHGPRLVTLIGMSLAASVVITSGLNQIGAE